ncbi:unnamed protein product [Boreogadus saida]
MDLRSAARGFLVFLLSAPALQGNGDLTVTYSSCNVCALRGATVDIRSTYEYADDIQYEEATVNSLWFANGDKSQPVDLEHDTNYTGRVEYSCGEILCRNLRCHGTCTLRIKDLRQSDSAVYKFSFTTRHARQYTGDPGVTLSVTGLRVKVSIPSPISSPDWTKLECLSTCDLAGDPTYIWFRNGFNVGDGKWYWNQPVGGEIFSCAVEGYEHLRSPVVSLQGTNGEGTVTYPQSSLVCALRGATADIDSTYEYPHDVQIRSPLSFSVETKQGPYLVFRRILSSDSGRYYCLVQTVLRTTSELINIMVKYGPKHASALPSPSGEIKEGSSVTLSCSSDANPAANYTWFKNNQPLLWGPSQPHTFPSVRPEDRGTYRCHAENKYGQLGSSSSL